MTPRLIRGSGESQGFSADAQTLGDALQNASPVPLTPEQLQSACNVLAILGWEYDGERLHDARRELQGGDVLKRPRRLPKK